MATIDSVITRRARDVVDFLSSYGDVRAAYVFGSHVEGTADQDSDIDIAAFIEGYGEWDLDKQIRVAVEMQRKLGDDLELHLFSAESYDDPMPASFAEFVQRHGIEVAK